MKGLIFTYALTYGGALASLFNPFYGLLVYFCFAVVRPEALWHWSVPAGGNYSRTVAIALLVGWALHGFGNWDFGRAKPVVYALLGYWGWCVLSAVGAVDQAVAWRQVEAFSKVVLPFVVGATLIDSVEKLKQVAYVLVLSQAYVALELNRAYYAGFNWVLDIGFGGMDNNCVSVGMVAMAGMAFFLGMGESVWWRKWPLFASAALMAHVPMFANSRGGMLGLIVTGVAAFFLVPKTSKNLAIFALATFAGLTLAGPSVIERFSTTFVDEEERDASAQSRIDLWRDCTDLALKNPLFGVGPGNWGAVAHTYGWTPNKSAHSVWFETAANVGLVGIGLYLSFFGLAVIRLWRLQRQSDLPDPWLADAARMVIASVVGFAAAASFVTLGELEIAFYSVLVGVGALNIASKLSVSEWQHQDALRWHGSDAVSWHVR